jgi:hypothetical protein
MANGTFSGEAHLKRHEWEFRRVVKAKPTAAEAKA